MAETEHVAHHGNAIQWTWLGPVLAGFIVLWVGNEWRRQSDEHDKDHTALAITTLQVEELKNDVKDVKGQVEAVQSTMRENAIKGDARWDWLEKALPADRRVPRFQSGVMFDK